MTTWIVNSLLSVPLPSAAAAALLAMPGDVPEAPAGTSLSLSPAQARHFARQSASRAAFVAATVDTAQALAAFVKDARRSVRLAAAANPALSAEQFLLMWSRAAKREDTATLKCLFKHLHSDVRIGDLVAAMVECDRPAAATMVSGLPPRTTRSQLSEMLASSEPALVRAAALRIARGSKNMTWEEASELADSAGVAVDVLASAAWRASPELTVFQASQILRCDDIAGVLSARRAPQRRFSAEAAALLAANPQAAPHLAEHLPGLPCEVAEAILAHPAAIGEIRPWELPSQLRPAVVAAAVRFAGDPCHGSAATRLASNLLRSGQCDIPQVCALLSALPDEDIGHLAQWQSLVKLTPELVAALVDTEDGRFRTVDEFRRVLVTRLDAWLGSETECQLLDLLPGWLATRAAPGGISQRGAEHIVRSLTDAGCDPSEIAQLAALAPTWEGTLVDLVLTLRSMSS